MTDVRLMSPRTYGALANVVPIKNAREKDTVVFLVGAQAYQGVMSIN